MASSSKKVRQWLLTEYGDGVSAPCSFCGKALTIRNVTIDHYPIPACLGGTIAHENVRPACRDCNLADGEEKSNDEMLMEQAKQARVQRRRQREEEIESRNSSLGRLTYSLAEVWQ